ncbi:MAG: transporter [Nitrococcus sp.]|nr:transporter [Nitrococcus sp.]
MPPRLWLGSAAFCSANLLMTAAAAAEPTAEYNFLGLPQAPLEGPIITDRPSFGDATVTVPYGRFLLESGYGYNQDGAEHVHNGAVLLLRAGLVPNLELRLGWDGYARASTGEEGSANTRLGLKIHALHEQGLVPDLVVIPEFVIPTGDADVAADEVEPEVRFAWSYALSPAIALGGNFNIAARDDAGSSRHRLEYAASLGGGYVLSERWSGYLEYFAIFRESALGQETHSINTGIAYLITDRLQLDAFIGGGLNEAADDVFGGFGISKLW